MKGQLLLSKSARSDPAERRSLTWHTGAMIDDRCYAEWERVSFRTSSVTEAGSTGQDFGSAKGERPPPVIYLAEAAGGCHGTGTTQAGLS